MNYSALACIIESVMLAFMVYTWFKDKHDGKKK